MEIFLIFLFVLMTNKRAILLFWRDFLFLVVSTGQEVKIVLSSRAGTKKCNGALTIHHSI